MTNAQGIYRASTGTDIIAVSSVPRNKQTTVEF